MTKDNSKKTGRPTKMTDWTVRKLEDAIKFGATVTEACYLVGISREMFYQHYRSDPDFSDKIENARSFLTVKAKHNLTVAILDGDLKTSLWLLDKRVSVPITTVQEEIPNTGTDDDWDEGDIEMLERFLKTKKSLQQQHGSENKSQE